MNDLDNLFAEYFGGRPVRRQVSQETPTPKPAQKQQQQPSQTQQPKPTQQPTQQSNQQPQRENRKPAQPEETTNDNRSNFFNRNSNRDNRSS